MTSISCPTVAFNRSSSICRRTAAQKVTGLLAGLADTIPDMAERDYYKEALICYKHGSLRTAVVMTWNIAFSHLCDHVLAKRLADFNARWLQTYPGMHKKKTRAIAAFDDFNDELKESEVLTICRDAGIINKNMLQHHAWCARQAECRRPSKRNYYRLGSSRCFYLRPDQECGPENRVARYSPSKLLSSTRV